MNGEKFNEPLAGVVRIKDDQGNVIDCDTFAKPWGVEELLWLKVYAEKLDMEQASSATKWTPTRTEKFLKDKRACVAMEKIRMNLADKLTTDTTLNTKINQIFTHLTAETMAGETKAYSSTVKMATDLYKIQNEAASKSNVTHNKIIIKKLNVNGDKLTKVLNT